MDKLKAIDTMSTTVAELDRGKRKVGVSHSYSEWDYLKAGESKYDGPNDVGVSGARQGKFAKGFYRRTKNKINPEEHRQRQDAERADRAVRIEQARREYLAAKTAAGFGPTDRVDQDQLQLQRDAARRKRTESQETKLQKEHIMRQKTGSARFHVPVDDTTAADRANRFVSRFVSQAEKSKSSVLGYGRPDLPSLGAYDNFLPMPNAAPIPANLPPLQQRGGRLNTASRKEIVSQFAPAPAMASVPGAAAAAAAASAPAPAAADAGAPPSTAAQRPPATASVRAPPTAGVRSYSNAAEATRPAHHKAASVSAVPSSTTAAAGTTSNIGNNTRTLFGALSAAPPPFSTSSTVIGAGVPASLPPTDSNSNPVLRRGPAFPAAPATDGFRSLPPHYSKVTTAAESAKPVRRHNNNKSTVFDTAAVKAVIAPTVPANH